MTRRRVRGRVMAACLLALLALAAAGRLGPASAQTIPPPDQDPFYLPPADVAAAPPGTILRSRQITVTGLGIPVPVDAWHLLYRSDDSHDRPIAAVATLLVPRTPYLAGPRPLLSYQMAIDSLGPQCNPSYTLRTGTQKEEPVLLPALAAGWAVVAADFEGPRIAYGAGAVAGHTVLDGIRAATRFGVGGIDSDTPVGLWGYSGGGQATAWAAELQPAYAPELVVAGVAQGGVPPDLEQVARQIDGTIYAGIFIAASAGLSREFPEAGVEALLNDEGRAVFERIGKQCAEQLVFGYPNQKMSDLTTVGDPLALPQIQALLEANRLGKAVPSAPVFMYHSVLDQLIPVQGPDALAARYCAAGATLYYERGAAGEHIAYAFTGGPTAFAYLASRFAGVPPPTNCPAAAGASPPPAVAPPPGGGAPGEGRVLGATNRLAGTGGTGALPLIGLLCALAAGAMIATWHTHSSRT